jgi:hypothetical protein
MPEGPLKAGRLEGKELKGAGVATGVVVAIILLLIGAYAVLEYWKPAKIILDAAGKPSAISDPWVLGRTLIIRMTMSLSGGLVLFWFLLGLNHFWPGDGFKKIQETSIGTSIMFGSCAIIVGYIFCFA